MVLFENLEKKIPKWSQKPNWCQKWHKAYKYPIFFHISSLKCYFLTLTFFLLVLTWNHPVVTVVTVLQKNCFSPPTNFFFTPKKFVFKKNFFTPKIHTLLMNFNNLNCKETQKLQLWLNWKTQIVMNVKKIKLW